MEYFSCCAAISLNNSAIALMERQSHYLAYETLKDALSTILLADKAIVNVTLRSRCNNGFDADKRHRSIIHERLDRATKLLSSSTCSQPKDDDVGGATPCHHEEPPMIVVVPATDAPSVGLLAASFRSGCYPLRVSPIRIEPTDADSILEGSDLPLVRAIMLYNYSLCLRCAWRSMLGVYGNASHGGGAPSSPSSYHDACKAAEEIIAARDRARVQVLREAAEIVTTELYKGDSKDQQITASVDAGKALSVAIVVYSAYLEALEDTGELEGAAMCSTHLLCLNRALVALFGRRIFYPSNATAAAA
jgi:hypothetical protein